MTGSYAHTIRYKKRSAAKAKPIHERIVISDRHHSYHEGANDERTAILAKVRRLRKMADGYFPLELFEKWLLTRVKRNKAKAGGL